MNLRPDQLTAQLARPLPPLWLLHGNEPLLVLEAADAIRAAAHKRLRALFETAADDDFHSGRKGGGAGHESWQPDFEYLLRESVIAKLCDRAMTEAAA